MSRVKICVWRPALQLHKVIQWVQSLFHWRKSTGSGPSSHLSSARVRTHPLQLLISTLKFGLWCMAPVWEERETDAATCPALLIASLLFSWSSSTFQLRQVRFHRYSHSFFGRPPASLYLERRVNTITSVPRPFKKTTSLRCVLPVLQQICSGSELHLFTDAGELSPPARFRKPSSCCRDFHSVSAPISLHHPASHSCITASFHTLNALPSGVWKPPGYLPPSCSLTSASCLPLTAVKRLVGHTAGFLAP